MSSVMIHDNSIVNVLTKLNTNSEHGHDGIRNYILKSGAGVVSKYLTLVFMKSLNDSELPKEWKTGSIVSIHKSGLRDKVFNYRSIP